MSTSTFPAHWPNRFGPSTDWLHLQLERLGIESLTQIPRTERLVVDEAALVAGLEPEFDLVDASVQGLGHSIRRLFAREAELDRRRFQAEVLLLNGGAVTLASPVDEPAEVELEPEDLQAWPEDLQPTEEIVIDVDAQPSEPALFAAESSIDPGSLLSRFRTDWENEPPRTI